jgi:hypothetical protein
MKQYLTRAACLLPLFLLSACTHKQVQNQTPLAPPIDDGPVTAPSSAPQNLPPPVVTQPQPTQPATTTAQNQDQPKPAPKHKKPAVKPASTSTTTTQTADKSDKTASTPPANQQASSGTLETSAIGQLSSGEPADLRTDTVNSLNSTEHSLKTLNRKLTDQEEKTSAQITEYIKQARAALASNDLDGAHTLATKAKLLLNELTQ